MARQHRKPPKCAATGREIHIYTGTSRHVQHCPVLFPGVRGPGNGTGAGWSRGVCSVARCQVGRKKRCGQGAGVDWRSSPSGDAGMRTALGERHRGRSGYLRGGAADQWGLGRNPVTRGKRPERQHNGAVRQGARRDAPESWPTGAGARRGGRAHHRPDHAGPDHDRPAGSPRTGQGPRREYASARRARTTATRDRDHVRRRPRTTPAGAHRGQRGAALGPDRTRRTYDSTTRTLGDRAALPRPEQHRHRTHHRHRRQHPRRRHAPGAGNGRQTIRTAVVWLLGVPRKGTSAHV